MGNVIIAADHEILMFIPEIPDVLVEKPEPLHLESLPLRTSSAGQHVNVQQKNIAGMDPNDPAFTVVQFAAAAHLYLTDLTDCLSGQNSHATVSFFNGWHPVRVIAGAFKENLKGSKIIKFNFLKAHKIGISSRQPFQKPF